MIVDLSGDNSELLGGRLRKRIKKSIKKFKARPRKARLKKITKAMAAVATGGASLIGAKGKAGRVARAVVTGGVSEAVRKKNIKKLQARAKKNPKRAKAIRAALAIATGGASVLAQKNKAGRIARAVVTGGASVLTQKNKAGKVARRVAGFAFAPVTTATALAVKKRRARKAADMANAQEAAYNQSYAYQAAAAPAAPVAAQPGGALAALLPLSLLALPFLLGE
ncbi:hypothetical protein EH223_08515 [candidate division KSB1 bacterium]|nr:MAG: hypothetical protein EH223_08515 [candidate division KSB1 bacterium]